jgi:membrane protein required for colicin V production
MGLTALDMLVLLLVGGGLLLGFMRGFITEVLSLLAWVAAIVALKILHDPATSALTGMVGTRAGAAVLAFALVFGVTFIGGKLVARQIGGATRKSVVGPIDRILGGGFGALKGLIFATPALSRFDLVYDTVYGRSAERPEWMQQSRTYPLLHASGRAIVDFVEARRGRPVDAEATDNRSTSAPTTGNDRNPALRHDGAGEARLHARRPRAGDNVCLRPHRLQSRPYRQRPPSRRL